MKPPHEFAQKWQRFIPSKQSHSKPPQEHSENWNRPYPYDESNHRCPMSSLFRPHKLRRKPDYDLPLVVCYACKGKHIWGKMYYYYCPICDLQFHRGCHMLPLEMKHSLHPSHSLFLTSLDPHLDTSKIPHEWRESPSDDDDDDDDDVHDDNKDVHDDDDDDDDDDEDVHDDNEDVHDDDDDDDDDDDVHDDDEDVHDDNEDVHDDDDDLQVDDNLHVDDVGEKSYEYYAKCKCCRRPLDSIYYHCSVCNVSLNIRCMENLPSLSISHPKSHKHPLILFPRRIPLPCDVCGLSLDDTQDLVYACLPCNFIVHESCIYLPRVIKVTRHQHRLSLTSSLPSGNIICGVCRCAIDVSCGEFSCNKGCGYSIHSKCATRDDVWDGIDLDGVPEEPEVIQDPFVRIDEETIQHFTHGHHLKLQGKGTLYGEHRFCEACRLPTSISDVFYSCMECEFILHEACASLPRIKHHPLHKHPLILSLSIPGFSTTPKLGANVMFQCSGCRRKSTGFMFICHEKGCNFCLDVTCASLPDTSIHESHVDHPLYINLTRGVCMGCKTYCSGEYIECMKCKSFLGLHCATLPSVAYYKHDSHPLTLCYGEKGTTSGQYWCEKCELKLDASEWFYTCDSCRVTLHVTCLLGIDMYMKPQHIIEGCLLGKDMYMKPQDEEFMYIHDIIPLDVIEEDDGDNNYEITRNDSNTRPFCFQCSRRCIEPVVYKMGYIHYCTLICSEKGESEERKRKENVRYF